MSPTQTQDFFQSQIKDLEKLISGTDSPEEKLEYQSKIARIKQEYSLLKNRGLVL